MSSASVMGKYAREYGTQKKHFSIARLQQHQGNIKRMGPLDLNHLTHHDIREFLLIINTAGLHLQGTDHQFVCSFIRGCHKQHSTSVYLISDSESRAHHLILLLFLDSTYSRLTTTINYRDICQKGLAISKTGRLSEPTTHPTSQRSSPSHHTI